MEAAKKSSKLSQEANRFIKTCRSIGLSDEEVFSLFNEVAQLGKRRRNLACSICKLSVGMITFLTTFVAIMSMLLAYKPTQYYIDHYGQNLAYPLLRGIRLLTLPLSTRFDVTSLYYEECLLDNPFLESHQDCQICEDMRQIPVVQTADDINVESGVHLFLWKDAVPHDLTMKDFFEMLEDNASILRPTMKVFSSVNTTVRSFDDALRSGRREEVHKNSYIYLLWQVRGSGALKLVRDLSWKPSFVPKIAEISPTMFIQLKGSLGERTTVPLSASDYEKVWLTQAQGESHIELSPVKQCMEKCPSVEATISARDILFFNKDYWRLSTIASGSKVNLQFISTFY